MNSEYQKYRKKSLLYFFLSIFIPPPAWFLLNFMAGSFTVEMILRMLLHPAIYIYIALFTGFLYRLFIKNLRIMDRHHELQGRGNEIMEQAGKAFRDTELLFLFGLISYVFIGPLVVMADLFSEMDIRAFFVGWLSGIPLIFIYASPFIIGFYRNLALYAADIPFQSEYRSMGFSTKIMIIIGQNAVGVILVFLLFIYYLETVYGKDADFSAILMFRMSLITTVSLGIIIINLILFSRSFSIPIVELRNSLASLAYAPEANLASRLRISSRDELGEIAFSFNLFISTIENIIKNSYSMSESVSASAKEISALSQKFDRSNYTLNTQISDVSASIEEISATLENIAELAGQQSGGISELVSHLQKWDEITRKMSEMQNDVMKLAESTADRARSGEAALKRTSESMHSIRSSADKITEVVGIIRGISEKVDLLALNASIEAARAGEAGRGFAVVAEEISRLAVKTAESIKEIDSHVQENTSQVKIGVENVDSTTDMISGIMNDTRSTSGKIHDLNSLMKEQISINTVVQRDAITINQKALEIQNSTSEERKSLDMVNKAIDKISQVSQETTQASGDLARDAQENEKIAESLRESVRRFHV